MADLSVVPQPRSVVMTGEVHELVAPGDLVESLNDELGAEAYRLVVGSDGAHLEAGSAVGLILGRSTWGQLVDGATTDAEGRRHVPGVRIEDEPTHAWRGLMVDCSRWFTPVVELEKLIDAMALHRMNRLHLHLTDDQGWRLEVPGWPLLTTIGARRERSLVSHQSTAESAPVWDDRPHEGHYTTEQLRGLVRYATERGIVIVPEVDLPGHVQAAVAAYPELGNTIDPVRVRDIWGISDHVLAPTETAFGFVRDVLSHVVDIFPSPWIHIGGDECPVVEWEASSQAQQYLQDHGLTSERQIQAEFIRVAHEVLVAHGRTMIGWDEILDAAPPSDAVVMLWRPGKHVSLAADAGLHCLYARAETLYLDAYQADPASEPLAIGGLTTIDDVYTTQVLPAGSTDAERTLLLGVQAQLWREYIPTDEHLEYMLFPRLCAVSELAWGVQTTAADLTDRLWRGHLARLDRLGVRYRPLD